MNNKVNNILVTGGAGYIGSHIIEELVKSKAKVVIFDNLVTGYKILINKKAEFIKGDIKNIGLLKKIIHKRKINTIIHLAAYLNVREAQIKKRKYHQNNVVGTSNIVKACKNSLVRNFIFSSSCSVYGNIKGSVGENKKPNPKGYYAKTKYLSENIIKKYAKKYKYKYAILRYFNVAGASKTNKIGEIETSHGHLIKNISIQATKKKPIIKIYGNDYDTKDGTCVRDYIHVSDLSKIHLKCLNYLKSKSKNIVVNCGYGKGYSVMDIVKKFKKIKKNVIIEIKPRRPGDVAAIYARIDKLKNQLKWKSKYNKIEHILNSSIRWEKKKLSKY